MAWAERVPSVVAVMLVPDEVPDEEPDEEPEEDVAVGAGTTTVEEPKV